MPDKTGRFTPRERRFVDVFAATQDAPYAATKAGYSSPQVTGYQKIANPVIREAVVKLQSARVSNELLPLAVDLLKLYLTDATRNDRIRLGAVQIVMKYSLGGKDEGETKEPHEMTPQELQARIDQLRRVMADKARPVIEGKAADQPEMDVFG
jgi:phage terminase small subunit